MIRIARARREIGGAGGVHRERALPGRPAPIRSTGAEVRDAAVGDEDVQAAVASTAVSKAARHGRLARHVHEQADARPPPTAAVTSSPFFFRARLVEIPHDHVRALGGQPRFATRACRCRSASGHQPRSAAPAPSPRRQRELVELERPVLDVVGVLRGERDVAPNADAFADDVDRCGWTMSSHDAGRWTEGSRPP